MAISYTPRLGLASYGAGTDPFLDRTTYDNDMAALDLLSAIDMQGLDAARPAAVAALRGAYWWSTDTKSLLRCDGTAWRQLYPLTKYVTTGTAVANAATSGPADANSLFLSFFSVAILIEATWTSTLVPSHAGDVWQASLIVDSVPVVAAQVTAPASPSACPMSLTWSLSDPASANHLFDVSVTKVSGTGTVGIFGPGSLNVLQVSVTG